MINKKLAMVGLVASVAFIAGCKKEAPKQDDNAKIQTLEQKVSYIIGQNIAGSLAQNDIALESDAFMLAVNDVKAAKQTSEKIKALSEKTNPTDAEKAELEKLKKSLEPRIPQEEAQKVMMEMQQKVMDKQKKLAEQQEADQKKLGEQNKAEGEKFLAENKTKPGVKTTASGLQYKVITEGSGVKPKATDTVSVHYTGKLVNGTEFDSSHKHGDQPVSFQVNGVIPGWTEALQLMPKGSKWELYIPSDLAYGPGGNGAIPPSATLIFEVELLDVKAPSAVQGEKK